MRTRLAPIEQIAAAPDVVVLDDPRRLGDIRLFARAGYTVLLVGTAAGVHALLSTPVARSPRSPSSDVKQRYVTMRTTLTKLALTAALALGATAGCRPALVPLTQEMREQNQLSDSELKNLQYYVSHTITLRRELESGGRRVTGNHKLVVVNGKTIEEVVVEALTPGICVGVDKTSLSISFEQGTSLQFVPAESRTSASPGGFATPPDVDPFPGNRPRAPAPRTDGIFSGGYVLWVEPSGTVPFMGKSFDAVEDASKATLLIDAEELKQVVRKHKVLPGLVLPGKS